MFHKSILSALVIAAGVGIYAVVKTLSDEDKKKKDTEDEVNFIKINEDDAPEETPEAAEEGKEEPEAAEVPDEIQEICGMYPYLKADFVQKVFERNDDLNLKYPEDTLITIYHKAEFEEAEALKEYEEILQKNGYQINVLDEKTVEVFKKMFTENGRIISDIYNVANQAACLNGKYKGFKVTV